MAVAGLRSEIGFPIINISGLKQRETDRKNTAGGNGTGRQGRPLKIYLDTSALIKLYIIEDGSASVDKILSENAAPLPVWDLHIIEFHNTLKLKVFCDELMQEAFHLSILFKERKKAGIYYSPELERKDHTELCLAYTDYSAEPGYRSLDSMHTAAA